MSEVIKKSRTFSLFSIPISIFAQQEYREFLQTALQGTQGITVHTVNSEMLVDAYTSKEFARILASAHACLPDGAGIAYASLALFGEEAAIYPGVDIVGDVLEIAQESDLRIAVCGAREKEHDAFRAWVTRRAPRATLLCIDPGIIDERDPRLPLSCEEQLRAFAPQVVLIALGQGRGVRQGKQEYVVQSIARTLPSARIILGVGGALDMLSGSLPRAPKWLRQRGCEWLYRFVLQPWRWKRIVKAVIFFPFLVAWQAMREHTFLRATYRVIQKVFRDFRF